MDYDDLGKRRIFPETDPERLHNANEKAMAAKVYFDIGDMNGAIAALDAVIEEYPGSAAGWCYRGIVKANMKKFLDAIDDFSMAIELQPEYIDCYANRAQAYFSFNRFDEAIADLNFILTRHPDNAMVLQRIGVCYVEARRPKEAIGYFDRAIALQPGNPMMYLNRAAAKFNALDTSACDDWRKARDLGLLEAESYLERFCNE